MKNKINYLEIPVKDINKTKDFFSKVFSWEFVDYGDEYTCFTNGGIDGGFYKFDKNFSVSTGAPLIVLYGDNLKDSIEVIKKCGGEIVKDIFAFPGGKRFHFTDPNGNEYALWSES